MSLRTRLSLRLFFCSKFNCANPIIETFFRMPSRKKRSRSQKKSRGSGKSQGSNKSRGSGKKSPKHNRPVPKLKKETSQRRKFGSTEPQHPARTASSSLSLAELQHRARSLGIPFGGMNKAQLIQRINAFE